MCRIPTCFWRLIVGRKDDTHAKRKIDMIQTRNNIFFFTFAIEPVWICRCFHKVSREQLFTNFIVLTKILTKFSSIQLFVGLRKIQKCFIESQRFSRPTFIRYIYLTQPDKCIVLVVLPSHDFVAFQWCFDIAIFWKYCRPVVSQMTDIIVYFEFNTLWYNWSYWTYSFKQI